MRAKSIARKLANNNSSSNGNDNNNDDDDNVGSNERISTRPSHPIKGE